MSLFLLCRHYFPSTFAIVFVVDSSDDASISLVREEFEFFKNEPQLDDKLFLLACNKQDEPTAKSVQEISTMLDIAGANNRVHVAPGFSGKETGMSGVSKCKVIPTTTLTIICHS